MINNITSNQPLLPVIILAGPTAIGKSDIALTLAKEINADIISADSRQIYKFMDIGTATPEENQLNEVKHHFINKLAPNQIYSAGRFGNEARLLIENSRKENKNIIVCGGSGMYIQAMLGMIFESSATDLKLRESIEQEGEKTGWKSLYKDLMEIDSEYAQKISPNDKKRISRAIEIFRGTGMTATEHFNKQNRSFPFPYIYITLNAARELIHSRINHRVDEMIESGLLDELKKLLELGYSQNENSLNTVGYKELFPHLEGETSLEEAVEEIKAHTRQFAKRQLTWFRKYTEHYWLYLRESTRKEGVAQKILELSQKKLPKNVMEIKL